MYLIIYKINNLQITILLFTVNYKLLLNYKLQIHYKLQFHRHRHDQRPEDGS